MAKACGASTVDLIANGKLKHDLQCPSEAVHVRYGWRNALYHAALYGVHVVAAYSIPRACANLACKTCRHHEYRST